MGAQPGGHQHLNHSERAGSTPVNPPNHLNLRRTLPYLAFLVAVTVLAAACASSDADNAAFGGRVYRHAAGSAPATPDTTTKKADYPVGFTSTTCPFAGKSANGLKIDCYTLKVPMSRAKLGEGTVELAVAVIHSTSPTPAADPVLYLDGGPGGSALAAIDMWTKPVSSILETRDIILIDQRGTGYSTPRLVCESLKDNDYSSDAGVVTEDCLRTLKNNDVDVAAFNTTENAADVADLFSALKLKQWNLFGISYGTRLALWIMKNHPEGIRSVVIDSVYAPGVNSWESIAPDLARAVHAIAVDCANQPTCNAAYPDVDGQLNTAVDRLNADDSQLGDELVLQLFNALYITEIMPDIPKAISLAAHGDPYEALDLLAGKGALKRHPELRDNAAPSSARSRPKMSEAMNQSVECAESAPLTNPTNLRAAFKAVSPQVSGILLKMYLRRIAVCNVWSVPANTLTDVHSDIPTLVLAGTYDPITPPEWGQRAASNLTHATFDTVTGSGHAVWADGDCPKQLIKQYLDDPTAPGPDCTSTPPDFSR